MLDVLFIVIITFVTAEMYQLIKSKPDLEERLETKVALEFDCDCLVLPYASYVRILLLDKVNLLNAILILMKSLVNFSLQPVKDYLPMTMCFGVATSIIELIFQSRK